MLINLASRYASVAALSATESLRQSLFGAGAQGVMFVPQPTVDGEQVLFQDSAGTTPVTTDGQPVGYVKDLSGNGNHATQGTAAAKPLYRTNGTLHWLEGDGVDDTLVTANNFTLNETYYAAVGMAFRLGGGSSLLPAFGLYPTSGNRNVLAVRFSASGAAQQFGSQLRVSVGTLYEASFANAASADEHFILEGYSGSEILAVEKNAGALSATTAIATGLGEYTGANLLIFSGSLAPGDFFGGVFLPAGLPPASDRTETQNYLANLAGVTL